MAGDRMHPAALKRSALIFFVAAIAIVANTNVLLRRQVPLDVARRDSRIVIARAEGADAQGIHTGDVLLELNGEPVRSLPVVQWRLRSARPGERLALRLQQHDSIRTMTITATRRTPLAALLPDRLSGLAFLVLGVWVWWLSHG
ncbi:MAG: PDZ domain-containing protein, partial [Chloroflexi bacterium]